ncbi:hypothetical protein Tco_0348485, partial [Tanacetum coccineum]
LRMTRRSSTKLVQHLDNPEQLLRSSRKLTRALSVNHLNLTKFDTSFEEEFEEGENTEAMTEPTMEEYMTTTREDYGSGIARLKTEDEDPNEHIEKVLEIANLFHIPNVTQDQVTLRVFPISLTRAASRWLRNEPSGSIQTWDALRK